MNCERCQVELEDFLDGELSAVGASAVKAHLAGCPDCRRRREQLERETEVFARFYEQTALEPSTELWESIRARIGDEPPVRDGAGNWVTRLRRSLAFGGLGSTWQPAVLRQVAFAALLVAVTVAATLYFTQRRDQMGSPIARLGTPTVTPSPEPSPATPSATPQTTPSPERTLAPKPPVEQRQPSGRQLMAKARQAEPQNLSEDELISQQVARAEREYQGVITLLERKIARNKESLDPALAAQYQSSLALIDSSIAASRRVLREHPKDPTAAQFLLQAYAKKVELMEEIAMR